MPLPEGYTELTPGPNPDYHADKIFMEASSPIKPPQQFVLDLTHLARLEPLTPGIFPTLQMASEYCDRLLSCRALGECIEGGIWLVCLGCACHSTLSQIADVSAQAVRLSMHCHSAMTAR